MIAPRFPLRFRRLAPVVAVVVLAGVLSGCDTSSSDAATITYKTGSETHTIRITRSDFQRELAELVDNKVFMANLKQSGSFPLKADQKNATDADLAAAYLELVVNQATNDAEFDRVKPPTTSQDRASALNVLKGTNGFGAAFNTWPKHLQNQLIDREVRTTAVINYWRTPSAEKLSSFYDAYGSSLCPSQRIVSHILVKDEATARSILRQLADGAAFSDLARSKSTDKQSGQNGGVVGCLQPGAFVKEFEDAANAAQYEVPTGPVHTQFGYHIILVQRPTYDLVRAELAQAVQQQGFAGIRDLVMFAMHVRIDPRYGTAQLQTDPQSGTRRFVVTPPGEPNARERREKAPTTTTTAAVSPTG